jgi:hypothetical protein
MTDGAIPADNFKSASNRHSNRHGCRNDPRQISLSRFHFPFAFRPLPAGLLHADINPEPRWCRLFPAPIR